MSVCNFSISVDSKLTRNLLKRFADGSFALFWCNLNFSCEFNQLRSQLLLSNVLAWILHYLNFELKFQLVWWSYAPKWYPNSFKQILLLLLANIFFLFYLLKARLEIQVKLSVDIFQIKSALLYFHIKILATISISMNRESPRCSGKEFTWTELLTWLLSPGDPILWNYLYSHEWAIDNQIFHNHTTRSEMLARIQ